MSNYSKWLLVCISLVTVCLHCGNDSDVAIYGPRMTSLIYGYIFGCPSQTRVYLINGTDTVASTSAKPPSNKFVFRDIPYGIYKLSAFSGEFAAETEIDVFEPSFREILYLQYKGILIKKIYPEYGSTIDAGDLCDDSLWVTIRFNQKSTYNESEDPISIQPRFLEKNISIQKTESELQAFFPTSDILKTDSLFITFRFMHVNSDGNPKRDSAVLIYNIDTTGYSRLQLLAFIEKIEPENLLQISREGSISIHFTTPMNRSSVENNISFSPPFDANFFWTDKIIKIVPSNSLEPSAAYTISIDTGAMTLDSNRFKYPAHIQFTTTSPDF